MTVITNRWYWCTRTRTRSHWCQWFIDFLQYIHTFVHHLCRSWYIVLNKVSVAAVSTNVVATYRPTSCLTLDLQCILTVVYSFTSLRILAISLVYIAFSDRNQTEVVINHIHLYVTVIMIKMYCITVITLVKRLCVFIIYLLYLKI